MDEIVRQLLRLTLFSSAVMIAVLLIRSIFENKLYPKVLSMLWIIVLVRLIIPINITSPIHFDELMSREASVEAEQPTAGFNQQQDFSVVNANTIAIENSDITDIQTDKPNNIAINQTHNNSTVKPSGFQAFIAKIKDKFSIFNMLAVLWILGMVVSLVINIIKMLSFKRKLSDARMIYDKPVYKTMLSAKRLIGIKQRVFIYESSYIETPVTMGVFNPKVILPIGFVSAIEKQKLGLILLHELCHIKRKDVLKNYIWLVASVVYWFNPIIYIAFKAYTDDVEYIVDETVLNSTHKDQRIQYSQSLIDAIKLTKLNQDQSKIALSFCTSTTKLRKRVENMIRPNEKRKMATIVSFVICAVLVVTCFTTACMKSEEQDAKPIESIKQTVSDVSAPKEQAKQALEVEPEKRPIKENPYRCEKIESKEHAVELAKQYSLYGNMDFEYVKEEEEYQGGIIHYISSDNGDVEYQLNDKDGTLRTIFVLAKRETKNSANISEVDNGPSLLDGVELVKEQDIKEKAKDIIYSYFPDYYTTIEFVQLLSNGDIDVSGHMVNEDGVFRHLQLEFDENLDIRIIGFPYGSNSVGAQQKQISKISDEKLYEEAEKYQKIEGSELYWMETVCGEHGISHIIVTDNFQTRIEILESDLSLWGISFGSYSDYVDKEFEISEDKAKQIAEKTISQYFPQYINCEFTLRDDSAVYYFEGIVYDGDAIIQKLSVTVAGNGDAYSIRRVPGSDSRIKQSEQFIDSVITVIKQRMIFVDESKLKYIKTEEDESENCYVHYFEYTSNMNTENDYSFTCQVFVNRSTGVVKNLNAKPIEGQFEMISKSKAEELGKKYIEREYGIKGSDLDLKTIKLFDNTKLYYIMEFFYSETKDYIVEVSAVEGKNLGISLDEKNIYGEIHEFDGGYNAVAVLTGDFFDFEIEYFNGETDEKDKFTVDNPFCWLMDSQKWTLVSSKSTNNQSLGYHEWIDILDCKIVRNDPDINQIVLYFDDMVYVYETDSKIFDEMKDMIQGQ